jgi:hypothetical protein
MDEPETVRRFQVHRFVSSVRRFQVADLNVQYKCIVKRGWDAPAGE